MDLEFIQIEIPLKNYERQVRDLIGHLLAIDEKLFPNQTKGAKSQREVP